MSMDHSIILAQSWTLHMKSHELYLKLEINFSFTKREKKCNTSYLRNVRTITKCLLSKEQLTVNVSSTSSFKFVCYNGIAK